MKFIEIMGGSFFISLEEKPKEEGFFYRLTGWGSNISNEEIGA